MKSVRLFLLVSVAACAAKPTKTASENTALPSASGAARPAQAQNGARISSVDVVTVDVKNPLPEARAQETIAVPVAELKKFWLEPSKTVVVDVAGNPLLSQLVDRDGDTVPDELVFQTDLGAHETKRFGLRIGERARAARSEFKVFGRFVRERHDDFAWENERIARRMYGPALETWQKEPLVSSGIDVWVKREKKLVVNDWYLVDDYHADNGEGGDFYSVGKTRGCGGIGIWANEALHVSKNFSASRVLANGPIRLVFELRYAPWDTPGVKIGETKRVILDAGKSFERFESALERAVAEPLTAGIGIANHRGSKAVFDEKTSSLVTWEKLKDDNGNLGCAVLLPPGAAAKHRQTESDYLVLARAPDSAPLVYYAGSGWDRSGDFTDFAAWSKHVASFARQLSAPVELSLKKATGAKPWGARMCDAEQSRHPGVLTAEWDYDTGLVLKGFLEVWKKTKDDRYFDYVKRTIDGVLNPDGTAIEGYALADYTLDNINMGKVLFRLRERAKNPTEQRRYEKALELLRSQLLTHPRTKEGGFWHKRIYPHQLWLDGVYMASPFMAEFAAVFGAPELFDDAAKQVLLVEKHTRDPKTGLLFHGWDESGEQAWANPKTGTSPSFSGRALGWYAMGVVDVLEFLPKDHPQRAAVLGVLERLAAAIASVQDKDKGVWWQVLDAPKRDKNYLEASASAMFVYALSKGVNHGWLDQKRYGPVAARGWSGILTQFVELDEAFHLDLTKVCKVAGLGVGPKGGPMRDGTFAYYTGELTPVVRNDPKGVGAFILASAERES